MPIFDKHDTRLTGATERLGRHGGEINLMWVAKITMRDKLKSLERRLDELEERLEMVEETGWRFGMVSIWSYSLLMFMF